MGADGALASGQAVDAHARHNSGQTTGQSVGTAVHSVAGIYGLVALALKVSRLVAQAANVVTDSKFWHRAAQFSCNVVGICQGRN